MLTAHSLALLATWFVLGQLRLVPASKLAEHRLEVVARASGLSAG